MILHLEDLKPVEKQYYLQHVVAPRPVAFASTIDSEGKVNLSPFSFFNLFSSNPPIVVFSPARRVRDNTTKHTLENVLQVPEVVINIVTYDMVQQVSLSSCEYGKGVDEFVKAGFTKEPATLVRPPMVKESKAKLECKVVEVKPLGEKGGAGNLVICEVLRLHINDSLLTEEGKLDQTKIELVARLGSDWYCRVNPQSLFKVPKPNVQLGIGFDALPESVRFSPVLTGNHLGLLAGVHELPVELSAHLLSRESTSETKRRHEAARALLDRGEIEKAWRILLNG